MVLFYVSANHDEDVFESPSLFDLESDLRDGIKLAVFILLSCIALAGCGVSPTSDSTAAPDEYLGFRVEDGGALTPDVKASLVAQLHIVESVGVSDAVLSFFKAVPIVVDPLQKQQPGEFANRLGRAAVFVQNKPMPTDRPIVLHELLHAYHAAILPSEGQKIREAYRKAIEPGIYPEGYRHAHFLENEREYFAIIGSIYLFGHIQQPPYDCVTAYEKTPEILEILARYFGPHECH